MRSRSCAPRLSQGSEAVLEDGRQGRRPYRLSHLPRSRRPPERPHSHPPIHPRHGSQGRSNRPRLRSVPPPAPARAALNPTDNSGTDRSHDVAYQRRAGITGRAIVGHAQEVDRLQLSHPRSTVLQGCDPEEWSPASHVHTHESQSHEVEEVSPSPARGESGTDSVEKGATPQGREHHLSRTAYLQESRCAPRSGDPERFSGRHRALHSPSSSLVHIHPFDTDSQWYRASTSSSCRQNRSSTSCWPSRRMPSRQSTHRGIWSRSISFISSSEVLNLLNSWSQLEWYVLVSLSWRTTPADSSSRWMRTG
jgi:hypothetical protein